jgi:hypothetical protein
MRRLLAEALPSKADIAGRRLEVRFVPNSDIGKIIRSPRRRLQVMTAEWSGRAPLRLLWAKSEHSHLSLWVTYKPLASL